MFHLQKIHSLFSVQRLRALARSFIMPVSQLQIDKLIDGHRQRQSARATVWLPARRFHGSCHTVTSSLVATTLSVVLIATAPEEFGIPECTDTLQQLAWKVLIDGASFFQTIRFFFLRCGRFRSEARS